MTCNFFLPKKEFSNLKVIILKAGKLDYFLWKPKGVCLVFVKILRCGGSRRTAVLGNLIIYRQQKKCLRGRRIHTKGGNEKNLHISIEFALIIWLVTKGKLSWYIWSWRSWLLLKLWLIVARKVFRIRENTSSIISQLHINNEPHFLVCHKQKNLTIKILTIAIQKQMENQNCPVIGNNPRLT